MKLSLTPPQPPEQLLQIYLKEDSDLKGSYLLLEAKIEGSTRQHLAIIEIIEGGVRLNLRRIYNKDLCKALGIEYKGFIRTTYEDDDHVDDKLKDLHEKGVASYKAPEYFADEPLSFYSDKPGDTESKNSGASGALSKDAPQPVTADDISAAMKMMPPVDQDDLGPKTIMETKLQDRVSNSLFLLSTRKQALEEATQGSTWNELQFVEAMIRTLKGE